jgi:multidrug efflux pump subunit AcrA (membrane-fusion protein)
MFDVVTDIPRSDEIHLDEIALFAGTTADRMAVAVAPSTGRFVPASDLPEVLHPGDLLGHITGGNGRADAVLVPVGATLREMLARPGQLVGLGQGLAYLERIAPTGCETLVHDERR